MTPAVCTEGGAFLARTYRNSRFKDGAASQAEPPGQWGTHVVHAMFPPSPGRLAFYFDQLGELLEAGVNLHEIMQHQAVRIPDRRLRRMSAELADAAAQGQSLAARLPRYRSLIPASAFGLLAAGERAGTLPATCRELADELRTAQKTKWAVNLIALWYGSILTFALLAAGLPRVIHPDGARWGLYQEWLLTVVLPVIVACCVLFLLARLLMAIPRIAGAVRRLGYHLPGIGGLMRRGGAVRFLFALEGLLRAGVELPEALAVAGAATGDEIMAWELAAAGAKARRGTSLAEVLDGCRSLPQQVRTALATADRGGRYDHAVAVLTEDAREARRRAQRSAGMVGYGGAMLATAVITAFTVLYMFKGYVQGLLQIFE